jgi:hypothetical protein
VFDIHQSVWNRSGELDERKLGKFIDGLMREFAASPEAKPLLDSGADVGYAGMMLEYSLNYLGVTPDRMSLPDFNEVVFDLFPRKVSTEPESARETIEELRAFWQFVHRQYGLDNAAKILATLDDKAVTLLHEKLADPSNYGMAKSFVMQGRQAGFDMTAQEGIDEFMRVYNSQLLGGPAGWPGLGDIPFPDPHDDWDDLSEPPPLPEGLIPKQQAEKRKARKRQRQARKHTRR